MVCFKEDIVKDISVSYMREYLKYAVEFEKHVYIWESAMNKVQSRMREIITERNALQNANNRIQNQLNARYRFSGNHNTSNKKSAIGYKVISKVILVIIGLILAISLAVGVFITVKSVLRLQASNSEDIFAKVFFYIPMCLVLGVIISCPVLLPLYLFFRSKYKSNEVSDDKGSERRREILLRSEYDNSNNRISEINTEESSLNERKKEISVAWQRAKNNLNKLYSENILFPKYRNFAAVTKLYEYLATGRCNTIQGHGGIYDTYENERLQFAFLENLVEINNKLSRIAETQNLLYQEMREANGTLTKINSSLISIEKTNKQIQKNTAITAEATKQIATETRWLTWHMAVNGY